MNILCKIKKFVKISQHMMKGVKYEKNNNIIGYYAFSYQLRFINSNGRGRSIKIRSEKRKELFLEISSG